MKSSHMMHSPQPNDVSSQNENRQNVRSQRKQSSYSDTDREIVAINTVHFPTPSSGVWSGGEMRVSPDRELTDGHQHGIDHRGVYVL